MGRRIDLNSAEQAAKDPNKDEEFRSHTHKSIGDHDYEQEWGEPISRSLL